MTMTRRMETTKRRGEWSQDDDDLLRRLWPDPEVSVRQLSVRLNRDPRAIRRRAATLRLDAERSADRPQHSEEAMFPMLNVAMASSPCCGVPVIPKDKHCECVQCGRTIKSRLGLSPSEEEIRASKRTLKHHALRAMQESA